LIPGRFGRTVMLPAGVVERIDTAEKKIYVDRTKDQIKNAPEYDQTVDTQYRNRPGGYYAEPYHIQTPGCDPGAGGTGVSRPSGRIQVRAGSQEFESRGSRFLLS
jgi:hypothetical protein